MAGAQNLFFKIYFAQAKDIFIQTMTKIPIWNKFIYNNIKAVHNCTTHSNG